jgi:hypothetical protein
LASILKGIWDVGIEFRVWDWVFGQVCMVEVGQAYMVEVGEDFGQVCIVEVGQAYMVEVGDDYMVDVGEEEDLD